jgi:hypothetical protein
MESNPVTQYPILSASTKTDDESTGVTEGEHDSSETTKKIWTAAEERAIEDTVHNRELAYDIDPLVKFITNIKRFSLLKDFHLTSSDDKKYEALIKEVTTFINDIGFMMRSRQSFTPLQIHGATHLQKRYTGNALTGLSCILNLEKHTDPLNASNYYYYQSVLISKNWLDPDEEGTETQKVWYIDEEKRGDFTTIADGKDEVFPHDCIIEILNNDAGESNIRPIISQIFIKNFLIMHLPNLITIVTSPDEEIIYKTQDAAGNNIVPQAPPLSLQTSDNTKYAAQLEIYNTWKSNLQTLADKLAEDRTKLGRTIHPDNIIENIVGSSQALNSEMLNALIRILDTQIAYGMGFSISLIDASGVELSTSQNVRNTIAVTLRGIQAQYESVAQDLIEERFSEAINAGIKFSLGELNPLDENEIAKTKKLYAEIVDILHDIGLPAEQGSNFISKYIDEALTMSAPDLSEEATEAAMGAIDAMRDYVDLMKEGDEENE